MRILIFGPGQCGSTRLYNVIRTSLSLNGKELKSYWIDDYLKLKDIPDDIIVKTHFMDEKHFSTFDYIFLPFRDLRDSYISKLKRNISDESLILKESQIFYEYKKHADLLVKYEDNLEDIVKSVLKLMKLEISDDIVLDIIKTVDNIKYSKELPDKDDLRNPFYKKTFLSKSHITDNGKVGKYKNFFSEEELKRLFYSKPLVLKYIKENNYDI